MYELQGVRALTGPPSAIVKHAAEAWGATVIFRHKGQSEQVYVAIGLSHRHWQPGEHHPPFMYAYATMNVQYDPDWTDYSVPISGVMPASMESDILDTRTSVSYGMPVAGSDPPDELVYQFDDDVYDFQDTGNPYTIVSWTPISEEVIQGQNAELEFVWRNDLPSQLLVMVLRLEIRMHGDWYPGGYHFTAALPGQIAAPVLEAPVKSSWPDNDVIDARVRLEDGDKIIWGGDDNDIFHTPLTETDYKDCDGSNYW